MIVSWNWLKEYVRLDMSADELIERLMMSGMNHEGTEDVDGDIAIDLEVTSNRPDCLGHLGIAREVAVLFDRELKIPPTTFAETGPTIDSLTSVTIESSAAEWCPQYRARVIENVKVRPSPHWMQRRLRSMGLTPISNVVDITNYVLLECGQPLHAFDFDKLHGKKIIVRNAKKDERFLAINNKEYKLEPWMAVIADEDRTVALAGVMGGAETEVSDRTKTILLESAEFAPLVIRKASRALDLSSDSSYRFERKIDPAGIAWASDRATHLLCELAGGTVAKGFIHTGSMPTSRPPITLRWSQVRRILGIDIPVERGVQYLTGLGLEVTSNQETLTAVPPTFRRDITREIDLVEEIGRVHGYESVAEDAVIPLAIANRSHAEEVTNVIRDSLCASGYFEAVTFSFTDLKTVESVRPWSTAEPLTLQHSSRKHENRLRQSLLPSLLHAVALNEARGNTDVQLYEVAQIYLPKSGSVLPDEPLAVGLASTAGMRSGQPRDAILRDIRGHLDSLFARLRLDIELVPAPVPGLAEGRAAELKLGGIRIGVLGFAGPDVLQALDLKIDVAVAELLIRPLAEKANLFAHVKAIPDQPASVRDLAIVLDENVRWEVLEQLVRETAPTNGVDLESLDFVDLYRGKQVPAGKKSIAFRLTYRAAGRTLTREEVDARQQVVIDAVATKLGGALRS